MYKTFKFKLYSSKKNNKLKQDIRICANIYNHCIALHRRYYKLTGKYLSRFTLNVHLTKLKKNAKYSFWKQIGSQAIQNIVQRIDEAYKKFFKYCAIRKSSSADKVGPPHFKKASKYKSFTLLQAGYKLLDGNKVKIGKTTYKYFKSRDIEGRIKTVTIKVDTIGDIYIYFVCDVSGVLVSDSIVSMTGNSAGFDFGLKTFLTSSDAEGLESPLFFNKNRTAIRLANRKLSRKVQGSNNYKKAKLDLARLHIDVANKRQNFHRETANKLVNRYDMLFFEDLNINAMKKLWGKKISDLGLYNFLSYLEHKCAKSSKKLIKINRFFPSSKTCSNCGCINSAMGFSDLKNRIWACPSCGSLLHRDYNAALNIKREGIKIA